MVVWYQLVDYYRLQLPILYLYIYIYFVLDYPFKRDYKEKNEKKKSAEKIVNDICLCHSHVEIYKNLAVRRVGHCKKFQVKKKRKPKLCYSWLLFCPQVNVCIMRL